jgi:hypothetical protein
LKVEATGEEGHIDLSGVGVGVAGVDSREEVGLSPDSDILEVG